VRWPAPYEDPSLELKRAWKVPTLARALMTRHVPCA
jgi:hypothetical protein